MLKKIIIAATLISPFGYFAVISNKAQSGAEDICSSIAITTSLSIAENIIGNAGIHEQSNPTHKEMLNQVLLSRSSPDDFYITFPTIFNERWVCKITFVQGKVANKKVYYLD